MRSTLTGGPRHGPEPMVPGCGPPPPGPSPSGPVPQPRESAEGVAAPAAADVSSSSPEVKSLIAVSAPSASRRAWMTPRMPAERERESGGGPRLGVSVTF
jgi:hypothetical protein